MQEYLLSPAVLVVFWHGWRTFVYSDASLGTPTTPGGLGAVITQVNPDDCKEYVCAFALAELTLAQRNPLRCGLRPSPSFLYWGSSTTGWR